MAESSSSSSTTESKYKYQAGFGNHASSEALPGALPIGQNSPQVCAYGLYAEQLTGSSFTAPRHKNFRSWLYRIRPSVGHTFFEPYHHPHIKEGVSSFVEDPNQFRWDPVPLLPEKSASDPVEAPAPVDFVDGMIAMAGAGCESLKDGLCIYHYRCNVSMGNRVFTNADGCMLIVPDTGVLDIQTEFGHMEVSPCEICVIPRGMKFSVSVTGSSRGYICEVFKGMYELPSLGAMGANGLANPRDFEAPVAAFVDSDTQHIIVNKFQGKFFVCKLDHSPYDVVAWHGNYHPYKYDLRKFNTMNSVSFDHPDPSIYTVLTCQTDEPGTAVCDFVIFPPRWMVMEHTFRPPYYHRNTMTEYMGMIYGQYDAKKAGPGGFQPGGASLHSCMSAHGPDANAFLSASQAELVPHFFAGGLAFMFESAYIMKINPLAIDRSISEVTTGIADRSVEAANVEYPPVQPRYSDCWRTLPKIFDGSLKPPFPAPK